MHDLFAYCLFFALLLVFLLTAAITLAGICGKLPVPATYLRILVGALLVEVASAIVYEFRKMDFSSEPQRLVAEINNINHLEDVSKSKDPFERLHLLVKHAEAESLIAAQLSSIPMTFANVGIDPTSSEKVRRLVEVYQSEEVTRMELTGAKQAIDTFKTQNNTLSSIFPDLTSVRNIPTAVEELFRNGDYFPLLEQALAQRSFYNVSRPEFVPKTIEPLAPDHPVSRALLVLEQRKVGPFTSATEEVYVSIPRDPGFNGDIAAVRSGSKFQNQWINLKDPNSRNSTWVHGTSIHMEPPKKDTESGASYELIQLTEESAAKLFGTPRFVEEMKIAEAKR